MTASKPPESDVHPPPLPPAYHPPEEVRMNVPADYELDSPVTLAPIDPETEAARQRFRAPQPPVARFDADPPPPARWQFTLRQLIWANTVVAVMLAIMQVLAPSLVAGALGVAAFALVLFVTVYQPGRREVYPLAWGLILVYLFAAAAALFSS